LRRDIRLRSGGRGNGEEKYDVKEWRKGWGGGKLC